MNKKILFAGAFCLFTIPFIADGQEVITLEKAIEITLQNNLQVKRAVIGEDRAQNTLTQSKLSVLPSVNATNYLNFNSGRSLDPITYEFVNRSVSNTYITATASVPVFEGFQRINQIAMNKYQLDANKSLTNKVKNDLTLVVAATYTSILSSQDLLAASTQQVEVAKQQIARIQKMVNAGTTTMSDLSQAQAQAAIAELNKTRAQNQLDNAYLTMAQLMERNPADKFEVSKPVSDIAAINTYHNFENVMMVSSNRHPDILLAWNQTMVNSRALKVARGNYYPRLTAGYNLNTGYSTARRRILAYGGGTERYPFGDQIDDNLNQIIGFSLFIPVFNGLSARTGVKQAKLNLQEAEIAEQEVRNTFTKVVSTALQDLTAAESNFKSATGAFNATRDAFRVIELRNNVGLANALEFNQAQSDRNIAELNVIQARYDFLFKARVIDYYLGLPLVF